jgi:probable phosphoglycerate mutase
MRLLLIRHGLTDAVGRRLVGRTPGIGLNAVGRAQAEQLVRRLQSSRIDAIFSSPLERACQTAQPLADARHLEVNVLAELQELDYGEWQGADIATLDSEDPCWLEYNRLRSLHRIPGGEMLAEAQARMLAGVHALWRRHPQATVALFGHADPLKALLAALLGMPLDAVQRLQLDPASVSALELLESGPRVLRVNCQDDRPDPWIALREPA